MPVLRLSMARIALDAQAQSISILLTLAVFCHGPGLAVAQVVPAASPRPAAHFLEQATFGPTAADVASVEANGSAAWLQQQFQAPESVIPDDLTGNGVRYQLFLNMANGTDQLRQRMLFALSQIIVVSSNKTGSGAELTPSLGNQLKEVARLIRVRSTMGPGRQVFFCSMGGFDTHASQDGTHTSLLQQLSQAMSAFALATVSLGLASNVTTFTQSEFSRTMQNNGSGTDHAWGSHQIVVGGAVKWGIYGEMPTFAFGGPDDANDRGVWIPTIASAQFGATLGRWFGASASELSWAFPQLARFATTDLDFMR